MKTEKPRSTRRTRAEGPRRREAAPRAPERTGNMKLFIGHPGHVHRRAHAGYRSTGSKTEEGLCRASASGGQRRAFPPAAASVLALAAAFALCLSPAGCGNGGGNASSFPEEAGSYSSAQSSSLPESSLSSAASSASSVSSAFSASSDSPASSSLSGPSDGFAQEPENGSPEGELSGVSGADSSGEEGPDSAFEEKFAGNPIDAAYREASMEAVSNEDMADLAETYAGYWEAEISEGYERLLALSGNDGEIESGQEQWLSGRDQAMRDISAQAAAAGGSMASVEEATLRMEYYRSRAKEIYSMLYEYDPDFVFQFSKDAAG